MDTQAELDQLRLSFAERDYRTGISQVQNWINTNGMALLKTNQSLPFDLEEANEIRKLHEKMELKCMKFLAFFVQMSLKGIPLEYDDQRQEMDLAIHNFSDRIKARRHVVVTCVTFYRHLGELERKLREIEEQDLDNIPRDSEGLNELVKTYRKTAEGLLKRLGHLREERDRILLALDILVTQDGGSRSDQHAEIAPLEQHLAALLDQIEKKSVASYEGQRLLELELRIEARMLQLEDEIDQCCDWLQQIPKAAADRYSCETVGQSTVDNDELCRELIEMQTKFVEAHKYGERLVALYGGLGVKFNRESAKPGLVSDVDSLYRSGDRVLVEYGDRLETGRSVFLSLDGTLNKVEDTLLAIDKDRQTEIDAEEIRNKYEPTNEAIHEEFEDVKKLASKVCQKMNSNLFSEPLPQLEGSQTEQSKAMIKMKIFTLGLKIRELDRHLDNEDQQLFRSLSTRLGGDGLGGRRSGRMSSKTPPPSEPNIQPARVQRQNMAVPKSDDEDDTGLDKYSVFLGGSRRQWESTPLPVTVDHCQKTIGAHKKLKQQSEEQWRRLQKHPLGGQEMPHLGEQKRDWDQSWGHHLHQDLEPRHDFLVRLADVNSGLDDRLGEMDDISRADPFKESDATLNKLTARRRSLPKYEKAIEGLNAESKHLFNGDFNNAVSAIDEKLHYYDDHLRDQSELQAMINEIQEFLPTLTEFRKDWPSISREPDATQQLHQMRDRAGEFDVIRLCDLARAVHGNTRRVDGLVEELQWLPKDRVRVMDATENERADLEFDIRSDDSALPRVVGDQFDLHWFKDNSLIEPQSGSRISSWNDRHKAALVIDPCRDSDTGEYRLEAGNTTQTVQLQVHPGQSERTLNRSESRSSVFPQFPDVIYAPIREPVSLKMVVTGLATAPGNSRNGTQRLQLLHKNRPVTMATSPSRPGWQQKVAKDGLVEFRHPAITRADSGEYKLLLDNQVVALTAVKVGEPPRLLLDQTNGFARKLHAGENVTVAIPLDQVQSDLHSDHEHKIIWRKDGAILDSSALPDDYRLYRDSSHNPVMEIQRFRPRMAGLYECEIGNKFGTRHAQVELKLCTCDDPQCSSGGGGPREKIIDRVTTSPSKAAPSPSRSQRSLPQNDVVSLRQGDQLQLEIPVSQRGSHVVWRKDGNILEEKTDPRIKISSPNKGILTLAITNTNPSDSGVYTALNISNNEKMTARVDIIPSSFRPSIQEHTARLTARLKETAQLSCVVRSLPFADKVNWAFTPTQGQQSQTLTTGPATRYRVSNQPIVESAGQLQLLTLAVEKVTAEDAGEYLVTCSNTIGTVSAKIPLVVAGDVQHKKSAPRFTLTLQRDIVVVKDDSALLRCKVVGNPTPVVQWKKDGHLLSGNDNIKIDKFGERHELSIGRCRSSDTGQYEAVASNGLGSERSLSQLQLSATVTDTLVPTVVAPVQRPPLEFQSSEPEPSGGLGDGMRTQLVFNNTVVRCPPQFVSTFADEIVSEGENLVLKCCLIGQPEPVVWWSYNTHFLKDNPRMHMSRQQDEYLLVMRDLVEGDSGRYSITAENSSGLATCSALVVVEKTTQRSKSVDRTKYPTSSKPMEHANFPCHTTLSHALSPRMGEDSRLMQASPHGWQHGSVPNTPKFGGSGSSFQVPESDPLHPELDVDVKTTKTKTTKTYHYSGPSGVSLPGVGFIPRVSSRSPSPIGSDCSSVSNIRVAPHHHHQNVPNSESESDSIPVRARFVSGNSTPQAQTPQPHPAAAAPAPAQASPTYRPWDNTAAAESRFSTVESSDCDMAL